MELVKPQFDKLYNFRDVGGHATATGQPLQTGRLFRSDAPTRLSSRDIATLQKLNIRFICDLRTPGECRKRPVPPHGIKVENIPLHDDSVITRRFSKFVQFLFRNTGQSDFHAFIHNYYHHIAFTETARIRAVLSALAKPENQPALIHCQAGKDRTGLIVALLQLLAGVSYSAVRADYLRTNELFAARRNVMIRRLRPLLLYQVPVERMEWILTAHADWLDSVHTRIQTDHGDVTTYLRQACAIPAATLSSLQAILLD